MSTAPPIPEFPSFPSVNEKEVDKALRPRRFDDFRGQKETISNLEVFVQAAKLRNEPLDHILFHGPPGLGKTSLAHIISNEMDSNIKTSTGPSISRPGDLAGLLTNLKRGEVLFIDEIHRLQPSVEEYLYPAMEDYKIDIILDSGVNSRSIPLIIEPFTLIGATTRAGLLTDPLRSRFPIDSRLEYYPPSVLEGIVHRSATLLNCKIEKRAAMEIAKRSRGTPRLSNNYLRRVRDFAQVEGDGSITYSIVMRTLEALQVDEFGLNELDNKILRAIIDKFRGGPVGLTNIATVCGEEPGTIEEVYEPFLIMEGFIKRTPRGRMATQRAYKHLKKDSFKDIG